MINAFKQIRLTNINISGNAGRVEAGASGSFAYLSELDATGVALNNSLLQLSGELSTGLGSGLFALSTDLATASGELATSIAQTGADLSSALVTASGILDSKIDLVSGNLNTYIDDRISGVIDMAPAALDTLNELAAALGDDENFASNLVTTLGNISGSLSSDISTASGILDSRITTEVSTLNSSLATASGLLDTRLVDIESNYLDKRVGGIISGNLDVTGTITASGGFEVNGGGASTTLFVENGKVGVNTETPSEALEVSGNGKFSGTVEVAAPISGSHATTKTYVDDLFAKQKSFSTPVTQNVESMSVSFPGSAFSSTPVVNVSIQGSVYYAFSISNRTTTGFDISFSDEVLENDIVLNVFASNQ